MSRARPLSALLAFLFSFTAGALVPPSPRASPAPWSCESPVRTAGGAGAAPHVRAPQTGPTRRTFSDIASWSQYVSVRDGVRLAVDVHLPKGLVPGERTATILHLSRYYRSVDIRPVWRPFVGFGVYPITERDIREAFVKAGYSWVDVDVRGAGASFGHRDYPLSDEDVRDGVDVIEWIVRQPWSSGVVGATGSSYDGTLASLLVRARHPALKAIAPRFSGWDVYGDILFPGGLFARALVEDWARLTSALDRGRLRDVFGWTATVVASGVRPVDRRVLPLAVAEHARNVDLLRLLEPLVHRDDPDPHASGIAWGQAGPGGRDGRPVTMDDISPHASAEEASGVPVYAYAGWFDGALARGAIRQFLANRHPGSRLRVGPWFHAGEFNASPYASARKESFDHARELIRFFDMHLRGLDDGFSRRPRVHYYTMGAERWRAASEWPPPGVAWESRFLAAGHVLSGRADTPEGSAEGSDRYVVDESVTSGPGSRWGLIVGTGTRRGYSDRRRDEARRLIYTSEPLSADVEVTGHPILHVFLSANAEDGALFAYLEDVWPDGGVRYVTEGALRLLHRKLARWPLAGDPVPFRTYRRVDAQPLVPSEVTEVVFDLLPTSYVFRAGHRLRLALAGADAGAFDTPRLVSPLVYDVHRDARHPSRLELPTYPARPPSGTPR